MVLRLDAAAEARAARLHRESIVADTLSGGPSLFTERMTKQALEDLARGKSAIDALVAARSLQVQEIATDAEVRRWYVAAWNEAGVTCVSATQGGLGTPPFSFEGDGCTERTDSGLSHFGVRLVHGMNELGVLVDLSHCGTQTAWDAIRTSKKPVAFTHTFSKVLSMHDRGKTDDLLKAVAGTGGYVGVLVVPFFISDRTDVTLETAVNHIRHVVDVCGIDHVGIGTDWGAVFPTELADKMNQEMGEIGFRVEHRVDWNFHMSDYRSWRDWPNLTRWLVQRGFSDEEIQKILGRNFLRVLEAVVG